MRFQVLGSLRVEADDRTFELRPGMPQRVLAMLLLRLGNPVMVDQLIDTLWPDAAPANAVKVVQTYVHRLRKDLGSGHRIFHRSGGYRIDVPPSDVDTHLFVSEIVQARQARVSGEDEQALVLVEQALRRWRGRPFSGVGVGRLFEPEIARLEEWHNVALEEQAELYLSCGRTDEAIAILTALLAEKPHRERPTARLMLALVSCGRRAEALELYHGHRQGMIEDLGLEPSTALKQLHVEILRDQAPSVSATHFEQRVAPRQLPPGLSGLVGRHDDLKHLDSLVAATSTAVIVVIAGGAGIGKTTLAVNWAHQVAHRYPDGQLYINLRGFDPGNTPVEPSAAVRGFLHALGVAPQRIPPGADDQAALYRTRLYAKRTLVLLDNARDAEQVRPLIPADPGCLVVITSRHQFTGLGTTHGAHIVSLGHLSREDSTRLLAARLGKDRVAAEPEAADDIIKLCSGLPLALAIAGARASIRRHVPLAAIAAEMHTPARLDPFRTADVATDIRAVFSWSERYLSGAAARLFRLLGQHPGPDISLAAAASLACLPVAMTQQILTELTEANLVISQTPGRYHLHDLVRAYAAERAGAAESEKAQRRLFDHYVEHAHAADMLLNPNPLMSPLPTAAAVFRDAAQALDWLTTEHHCLLTALAYAAEGGWDAHAWQLGLSLAGHLFRRGYWLEHLNTAKAATASALRCADTQSKVQCKINVARAELQLCGFDAAETHLRDALLLAGNTTDGSGKAEALHVLSWVLDLQGHRLEALVHAEQALKLFQAYENRIGEARAMNTVGWLQSGLGNHTLAIALCERALRLHQEAAFREGESATWHSIGFAQHHLGNYAEALTCYGHALRTCREIGYRLVEGLTLACLGDTHTALGAHGTAEEAWRKALIILEELNHPDAATVRANLSQQRR